MKFVKKSLAVYDRFGFNAIQRRMNHLKTFCRVQKNTNPIYIDYFVLNKSANIWLTLQDINEKELINLRHNHSLSIAAAAELSFPCLSRFIFTKCSATASPRVFIVLLMSWNVCYSLPITLHYITHI